MPLRFRARLLLVAVLVAVAALSGWRLLRGPQLPGYVIDPAPLVQTVVATGRVISVSRVQVGAEITATVAERRVQEGDRVKPGDVLVVLRADDLVASVREARAALDALVHSSRPQAEAALRQAEAQLEQASRERARREDVFARGLIARELVEQAVQAEVVAREAASQARARVQAQGPGGAEEQQLRARLAAAEVALARTELRSAVSGTVLTRNVEPGDLVQPGKVLLEIASDGITEVEVPVDEKNLSVLALGQPARCVADAFPNRPFDGLVSYIAPSVDAQRGSINVRVRVDPVPEFLRQDMTVSVNVETGRRESALVVPNDALRNVQGDRATVLAVRGGRAQPVEVALGLRGLTATEVTEGLQQGERVLADAGGVDVKPGSRVRVAPQPLPAPDAGRAVGGAGREVPLNLD